MKYRKVMILTSPGVFPIWVISLHGTYQCPSDMGSTVVGVIRVITCSLSTVLDYTYLYVPTQKKRKSLLW